MTEQTFIKTIDSLLCVAIICVAVAVTHMPFWKEKEVIEEPKVQRQWEGKYFELLPYEKRQPSKALILETELKNYWDCIDISYTAMETEYLGRYFITAYCPEECGGSWTTSSSTRCHYSDDWSEPTTCAIDRRYHGYYEILQVGDGENKKLYRTEDTGPGVRGLWVDCFVETMSEVRSWNTRYDNVYAVSYKTYTCSARERIASHVAIKHNFLDNTVRYRCVPWIND